MIVLMDLYLNVLLRAGEGYAHYMDRARYCLWKAIDNIVKSGEYNDNDIAGITNYVNNNAYIGKSPLLVLPKPYEMEMDKSAIISTQDASIGIIRYNHADYIKYGNSNIAMSDESRIKTIVWTDYNGKIYAMASEAVNSNQKIDIAIKTIGISNITLLGQNEADPISDYISGGLAMRAVEMATQLIIQELRG